MVSEKNRHLYDLDQRNDIETTARKKWVVMDTVGIERGESRGNGGALQYPRRYSTARVLFT
jgi:hypothetical protein